MKNKKNKKTKKTKKKGYLFFKKLKKLLAFRSFYVEHLVRFNIAKTKYTQGFYLMISALRDIVSIMYDFNLGLKESVTAKTKLIERLGLKKKGNSGILSEFLKNEALRLKTVS